MVKKYLGLLAFIIFLTVLLISSLFPQHRGLAVVEQGNNLIYLPIVVNSHSPSSPPVVPTPEPGFSEQVVVLVNQQRVANGCGEVSTDERLRQAAQNHSQDMALNDYFSHTSLDGSTPWDRIIAQGYSFSEAGENIAAGYSSPESVVNAWMNSQGHRENILNCNFLHIGIGYYYLENDTGNVNYYHYWTQVFGRP